MEPCITPLTTLDEFKQKVGFIDSASPTFARGKARVVMIKSEGCPSCGAMRRMLDAWAVAHPRVDFYTLNTEGNGGFLIPLGITAVPTLFFINQHGTLTQVVGTDEKQHIAALEQL